MKRTTMFKIDDIYTVQDLSMGYYGNECPIKIKAISPLHALQCLGYLYINNAIPETANCIVTNENNDKYYYHAYKH